MKRTILACTFAVAICSCGEQKAETTTTINSADSLAKTAADTSLPKADNSQTSLDWAGTYKGVVPCADCDGMETTIVLNKDMTYVLTIQMLAGKTLTPASSSKGSFKWDANGSQITMDGTGGTPSQYKVGENVLIQLDANGQPLTGANADKYRLTKQ